MGLNVLKVRKSLNSSSVESLITGLFSVVFISGFVLFNRREIQKTIRPIKRNRVLIRNIQTLYSFNFFNFNYSFQIRETVHVIIMSKDIDNNVRFMRVSLKYFFQIQSCFVIDRFSIEFKYRHKFFLIGFCAIEIIENSFFIILEIVFYFCIRKEITDKTIVIFF